MAEQALAPVWTREPRGMPDMRRLAKRVVDGMPRVQAAVLFGSRARKTARRDSDWDVALLAPERYKEEVLRTAPRIPAVSYVALSPKRLRERHNRLGTLERSVAEDGVLLAGEWTMPESQKRPVVSYPKLAKFLETSAAHIDGVAGHVQTLLMEGMLPSVDNSLCSGSQKASEHLAKAALLHLCVHPARTHNALGLAYALQEKHPNHPWYSTIVSFNGFSNKRHTADYEYEEIEKTDYSLDRLCRVMKFYEEVLTTVMQRRPGFAWQASKICRRVVSIVSKYQGGINWDKFPDGLMRHLLQWKQVAEEHLKNEAAAGNRSQED